MLQNPSEVMITGDYLKTATAIARCGPVVCAGVQAEIIEGASLFSQSITPQACFHELSGLGFR